PSGHGARSDLANRPIEVFFRPGVAGARLASIACTAWKKAASSRLGGCPLAARPVRTLGTDPALHDAAMLSILRENALLSGRCGCSAVLAGGDSASCKRFAICVHPAGITASALQIVCI